MQAQTVATHLLRLRAVWKLHETDPVSDCDGLVASLRWDLLATSVSTDPFATAAWPEGVLAACGRCVGQRRNVLVAGIAGAGKTTLTKALARLLPYAEPVLVLDDCEEMELEGPLREFIRSGRGASAQSTRDAVERAAPRFRQCVPARGWGGLAGTRRWVASR